MSQNQIPPFKARRTAGHLRSVDTERRAAENALYLGDLRELVTHLVALAHEAQLALADLAKPPTGLSREGT